MEKQNQKLPKKNVEDTLAKELQEAMKQYESEKARENLNSAKDNYSWLDDDDFMVTEEEMMS